MGPEAELSDGRVRIKAAMGDTGRHELDVHLEATMRET